MGFKGEGSLQRGHLINGDFREVNAINHANGCADQSWNPETKDLLCG